MNEQLENLFDFITAGEWGSNQGTPGGLDTGVIRSANFTKNHRFNTKEIVVRSIEERKRQKKLLCYGDILIEKSGGSPDQPVGRVLFYDLEGEHTCSNFISILRPSHQADPKFLYYSLCNLYERGVVKNYQQQTTGIINLQLGEYLRESIFFPPLPEQKKIAEILSGIDKRIKLAMQRVSQLEALIKSLGQNYFGTANQYDMKSIGELFEISSGTTPSRARQDYFCRKDGTPWVKTMDLNDNYIRNTDECLTDSGVQEGKARIFPKGTLLVAMYGGWNQIGRTGILAQNSSCNQAMSALLPTKEVLPEFLNLQLIIRRSYWKGVAASSRKDPNITKSDVAEMPIVIPPVEDQLEIAKTLGSVMNSCQKEDRYLESLNLLKQSVASVLLSGRKRVSA
jgi:type I restriction enzyme S subunit